VRTVPRRCSGFGVTLADNNVARPGPLHAYGTVQLSLFDQTFRGARNFARDFGKTPKPHPERPKNFTRPKCCNCSCLDHPAQQKFQFGWRHNSVTYPVHSTDDEDVGYRARTREGCAQPALRTPLWGSGIRRRRPGLGACPPPASGRPRTGIPPLVINPLRTDASRRPILRPQRRLLQSRSAPILSLSSMP
jgi:hypothetical protein